MWIFLCIFRAQFCLKCFPQSLQGIGPLSVCTKRCFLKITSFDKRLWTFLTRMNSLMPLKIFNSDNLLLVSLQCLNLKSFTWMWTIWWAWTSAFVLNSVSHLSQETGLSSVWWLWRFESLKYFEQCLQRKAFSSLCFNLCLFSPLGSLKDLSHTSQACIFHEQCEFFGDFVALIFLWNLSSSQYNKKVSHQSWFVGVFLDLLAVGEPPPLTHRQ